MYVDVREAIARDQPDEDVASSVQMADEWAAARQIANPSGLIVYQRRKQRHQNR